MQRLGLLQLPFLILFSDVLRDRFLSDVELHAGLTLASANRKRSRRSSPFGAVYAGQGDLYPGTAVQSVELLRFITAYGIGLEALVDITPYSPMLTTAMAAAGNITLYSFIDTWVGNSTEGTPVMYMNNETGMCTNLTSTDGNGWSLTADLLFWPRPVDAERAVDTKPYASVTLASGMWGSDYKIGAISVHEATLQDNTSTVILDEPTDFRNVVDASVYRCESGANEIKGPALFGYMAKRARQLAIMKDKGEAFHNFEDEMYQYFALGGSFFALKVDTVFAENLTVRGTFDPEEKDVVENMPVFHDPSSVFTDQIIDGDVWWNGSVPLVPVGKVVSVDNDTIELQLNSTCLPRPDLLNMSLPRLILPVSEDALPHTQRVVKNILHLGELAADPTIKPQGIVTGSTSAHTKQEGVKMQPYAPVAGFTNTTVNDGKFTTDSDKTASLADRNLAATIAAIRRAHGPPPLLQRGEDGDDEAEDAFKETRPIGQLDLEELKPVTRSSRASLLYVPSKGSTEDKQASNNSDSRICVVTTQRHGHLFHRDFQLPKLEPGDRVIAQLTVTGHGWAQTTEQCGEYCHAGYSFRLNDGKAIDVSQFRDDCKDNPLGEGLQKGTWWESRNGWCPGSVEPGLFFDVTDHVVKGQNHASFDATVWSNVSGKYQPYSDYAGFAFGDRASLAIGLSLFVYDAAAVKAVKAQPQAFTAAEKALRTGTSNSSQMHLPAHVEQPLSIVLRQSKRLVDKLTALQRVRRHSLRGNLADAPAHGSAWRFDFEKRAPWYAWNSTAQGDPQSYTSAEHVLNVFKDRLMQSNTRVVLSTLDKEQLPADWGRVALHLRLSKPPGNLEIDHWDRKASFGLLLDNTTDTDFLHLRPAREPRLTARSHITLNH